MYIVGFLLIHHKTFFYVFSTAISGHRNRLSNRVNPDDKDELFLYQPGPPFERYGCQVDVETALFAHF